MHRYSEKNSLECVGSVRREDICSPHKLFNMTGLATEDLAPHLSRMIEKPEWESLTHFANPAANVGNFKTTFVKVVSAGGDNLPGRSSIRCASDQFVDQK